MNKTNTLNYPKSAAMDLFSKGLKNEFETAVVNKPSVVEPLKFYCIYKEVGGWLMGRFPLQPFYQFSIFQILISQSISYIKEYNVDRVPTTFKISTPAISVY